MIQFLPSRRLLVVLVLIFSTIALHQEGSAQVKDSTHYITIRASEKYNKSKGYQRRWGVHYRPEWYTPVTFKRAMLDTLAGGLTPYQQGGGRQSKSLRLQDTHGREYVIRSIDKSFGKALPEITQGTFIEKIVNDQVTIGHPYSALTIPPMAEAARIYHTNPSIYYIPRQAALGRFSDTIGNTLYLFEQRPDENWETAPNFGYAKKIVGTPKMLEKIHEDNDNSVDQLLYVRSRLFDMFIGDWGRHEDQWRWAAFKDGNKTMYKPIPRDRDQAYTKFDGRMLKILIPVAGVKHLQTFDHTIKDIRTYNFPARNLDYHLTNEVTLEQWTAVARDLQGLLTDEVIDNAIRQLPPEVYNISGPDIAAKLKSRRSQLPKFAEDYYRFIAEEVEITGSEDTELFEVKRLSDTATEISIYKITNEGKVKNKPFYHRIFDNRQTKEIRLYGLDGEDQYKVTGNVDRGIKLRLIGGPAKDHFVDESGVKKGSHRTKIYDNRQNEFKTSGETALRLSSDTAIHAYNYDAFEYDKKILRPIAFYNNEDRIYVGLAYSYQKHQWRKKPYGHMHYLDVKYSLSQKAFSTTYENRYTELAGKWDLITHLNYDAVRWTNFYGLGNNTLMLTGNRDFYRMRTREFYGSIGLERIINNKHRITFLPHYQTVKIINDTARFVPKYVGQSASPGLFKTDNYAGAGLSYVFQSLNDSILPTKGIGFQVTGDYTWGLKQSDNSFGRYTAELNLYLPITKSIGLAIKGGGSTLSGTPRFYQYNRIGGSRTLRGYQRDRFYGNSTFYNQNELRFLTDVRSFIYNGKIGVFGLYDIGRVWLDGEKSNTWHYGYGGGIILSPFNRISVAASYAMSPEDKQLHLAVIKVL
jgi:hypothetical protein